MGRTFVGGRSLIAGVGGLGQLGFGTGQTIGQLGYLTRKLEDDAVLLLHVALQEGQTFFEVMKPGIHGRNVVSLGLDARTGDLTLTGEVEVGAVATEETGLLGFG
jgi:hypothetical protein